MTESVVKAAGAADEFWALTENVVRPAVVAKADRVIESFDEVIKMLNWGCDG